MVKENAVARPMSVRVVAVTVFASLSLLPSEALASDQPVEPPAPTLLEPAPAQPESTQPQSAQPESPHPEPIERSRKGMGLMVPGGLLMAGGVASGIAMMFIGMGDGLAGGDGWTPKTRALAVAFPVGLVGGGTLLISGAVINVRANARTQASARRLTPMVALGLDGGQLGVRLRF